MLSIGLQIVGAWITFAVIVGLVVGASIRSAERIRMDGVLADLFSFLAKMQSTR